MEGGDIHLILVERFLRWMHLQSEKFCCFFPSSLASYSICWHSHGALCDRWLHIEGVMFAARLWELEGIASLQSCCERLKAIKWLLSKLMPGRA